MFSHIKNLLRNNKQVDKPTTATDHFDKRTAIVTDAHKLQDAKAIAAQQVIENERRRKSRIPVFPGLERFELLEKIGDGAFSVVYKARDSTTGKNVAVKVVRKREVVDKQDHLHPSLKKKPRATERANILKEVQIMQKCKHPNLVSLVHFSETDDYFFLGMELCPGGELFHQIVNMTYFSEELARHVITQVAHAIRFLHEECGIVHRDIKPENILFDPIPIIPSRVKLNHFPEDDKADEGEFRPGVGGGGIGTVKLADFGLSKVIWDNATKTPCGTVGYTAPEIVRDQTYSKGVDMWALGCVLYTMLCGFPPFYDESIHALTRKVAGGEYTFLSPWWDPVSDSAKDLISHLLTVDPEQRYTIDEFLNHPWVTQKEPQHPQPHMFKHFQVPSPAPAVVTDTPATSTHRRKDVFSPGVASLKEILDITYAVHRLGEEKARKLSGLAEEEAEDQDDDDMQAQRVDAATGGGTRNGGFNLDMKKATLLKRRKNAVPVSAA
ncbi:kinase-like domain-containing protein [Dichotomocladium elegans]|nr:kinase-like domain-containing protein [Dichotomocladium elegans]